MAIDGTGSDRYRHLRGQRLITGAAIGGLATIAAEVLQHAREISLDRTSSEELAPLRNRLPETEFAAVARHGLAAYLVAGPSLQRKLTTDRHSPGEPACPEGVAVVHAAVDWSRCGRTDAIGADTLRTLSAAYLPTDTTLSDNDFQVGLDWALRPVAATIAVLQPRQSEGYRAYDHVVRLVTEQPGTMAPREQIWAAALDTAAAAQAFTVGIAAVAYSRTAQAIDAFTRARDGSVDDLSVFSGFNLGIALSQAGRSTDAITACQWVADSWAEDVERREVVAKALYNKGVVFGALGRFRESMAAYQQVIDGYGDQPDAHLVEHVAAADYNQGVVLFELGEFHDALGRFEQVIEHYGDDPRPATRSRVIKATVNKGFLLSKLGRPGEAVAIFQLVVDRYGEDSEPGRREQVAMALINQGAALERLGRHADAAAVYQRVIDRYGTDPDPALRRHVERATNYLRDSLNGK